MKRSLAILTLLAGAIAATPAILADDSDARVARVSYVGGDVSYQRGDDDGWNDLRPNTPLVTGDAFYAADGGRAEVDLGSGVVVRVDGGTEIQLVNNSRDVAQISMTGGVLDVRARLMRQGFTLEIDTPSGAVTIFEPGRYRVEVTDNAATYSVVSGGMSLALDGDQLDVRQGESLTLDNGDTRNYAYGDLGRRTAFTSWADDRDSRYERSTSARYVNREVVGYEDLDDHGSWRDSSGYGRVWVPSGVSAQWAPYQSGRWIWQDPYGWTWVSNESWGWAPYHYGRWVYADNYWGWVPPPPRGYRGPVAVMNIQPVYAPALVAFVGGRNWGVSLSIGGPAIGWVPLAPREQYYYPWQPAPRVTNNYTNITVNNAVTIVNYNTFGTSAVRPIRVEQAQIRQAPVLGFTAVGVVPTRGSLVVAASPTPRSNPVPPGRSERQVVARLVPPPRPQPFTQKVVEIEKSGRPVARPVAIEGAVGKPFAPGAPAPTGVRPFSARGPGGSKELKARAGEDHRAPKRIERDIAPPPPAAAGPPAAQAVAPPPSRSGNGHGGKPDGTQNGQSRNNKNDMDRPVPASAPPTKSVTPTPDAASPARVRPEADPTPAPAPQPRPGNGEGGRPQGTAHQPPPHDKNNNMDRRAPAPVPPTTPTSPAPDAASPARVRPEADPTPAPAPQPRPGNGEGGRPQGAQPSPKQKDRSAAPPPVEKTAPPAPAQTEAKKDPATSEAAAIPPKHAPKGKKPKPAKPPVPPPVVEPPPPQSDRK